MSAEWRTADDLTGRPQGHEKHAMLVTMGKDDAAVLVRGLEKSYQGHQAVDGIDLNIETGEILAILGPNGAGKTTTIEILAGQRSRTAGTVEVLGEDPADSGRGKTGRAWRARIGIVGQGAGAAPELTVTELVSHVASFYPHPRDPQDIINLTGLTDNKNQRIGTLSGGQSRRVDVARAVVGRPELLFLDEPTTGFDPEARRQFWALIRQLSADGTTILLTTHYLEEAAALATRIAVIAQGRLVAEGSPSELGRTSDTDSTSNAKNATVSWDGLDGQRRTQHATAPTRLIADLARDFNGEIPGLTVTRPALEDIYLELIAGGKQ
jgi:ABC-2 type transport system ATP-binding protein